MSPVPPASTLHTVIAAVIRLLLPNAIVNTTIAIVPHRTLGQAHHDHCIIPKDGVVLLHSTAGSGLEDSDQRLQPLLGAQLSALSSQRHPLGGKAAVGPRLAVECLATVRQSSSWSLT